MKKNIYFLILLLAGMASYGQQNVLATVQLPGEVKDAIIREYEYPQTISYIRTSEGCCFALADAGLTLTCAWLDCDYEINDFEIHENIAFFCGISKPSKKGIVGWFDCQALFSGGDGYHIYDQFNVITDTHNTVGYVKEFSDLTIFTSIEDEYLHVALVGTTDAGTACAAELKGNPYTNSWSYITGGSPDNRETMTQIVTTDGYVVTGGTFEGNYVGVSMRVFLRYDMFPSSPYVLYNEIHRYSAFANPCEGINYPMYPPFKMSAANGDSVATASFFYEPILSYPPCPDYYNNNYTYPPYTGDLHGIVTHIFDIPTTISTPGAPCAYNSYVIDSINNGNDCKISSLTYSHPASSLQALFEISWPSSTETVLDEFSVPTLASIPYTRVNDYWFYCHDNFEGENRFVSIGKERNAPNMLAFYTQPLMFSNPQCGIVKHRLTDVAQYRLKDETVPLLIYDYYFEFNETFPQIDDFQIIIQCSE